MIGVLRKIFKYLIMEPSEAAESLTVHTRYKHFRRTLFIVMTAISMIPLIVTSVLSYYQYLSLMQKEAQNHLRWNAESANKTIRSFVEELQAVIVFVSEQHSGDFFRDQQSLSGLFTSLKRKYPGVVDLGFINPEGVQETYAGPYNLRGKKYGDREWFLEATARGVTISNVFLGYRKVPHFVIAISKKLQNTEDYWVLRVSIDAKTLDQFIGHIESEASDDIFLIDEAGVLQTTSRFYGAIIDEYPLTVHPDKSGSVIITVDKGESISTLKATSHIVGTPWYLILVKRGYTYGKNWIAFQVQLLIIGCFGASFALLVIIRTANILGERIRESDQKREAILSEVEHTSKLASIGRLAAGVAHEINNPLAIISEKTGLMRDILDLSADFPNKNKYYEQIDGTMDAVNRCKVITHRLLGFARRMDVNLESIRINEVVREVLSFLDKEALYRGIKFNLNLRDNLPNIKSDRGQLQQILLNIINNAIDVVDKGGAVSVSTSMRDAQTMQVDIKDDGPGIPPDIMKHIFEPFFTTKTDGEKKGTGLGLSITYGLVKKLGGEISVASIKDMGTTFTVLLPIELKAEFERVE